MTCSYEGCERDEHDGSEFCIFHMPAEEKEKKGLWDECMEKFYDLVRKGESNFRGFVLKDVNFPGNLGDLVEEREVEVGGKKKKRKFVVIKQEVYFGEAEFHGDTIFYEKMTSTWFENRVFFIGSTFNGEASYPWTIFSREVDFSKATFNKDVNFLGMTISGKKMDFSEAIFHRSTSFINSTFNGEVSFFNATFNGYVSFFDTIFRGEKVDFRATFNDNVYFEELLGKMTFKCNVVFQSAKFRGESHFKGCEFQKSADFTGARFSDVADFTETTFGNAIFVKARFEKGGSFDDCVFDEGDFSDAYIQYVSFRRVNLDNVKFSGAQMEFAYLSEAYWTEPENRGILRRLYDRLAVYDVRYVIREEYEARSLEDPEEKIRAYRRAEGTYRRIKHSLTNEGAYDTAGEFYIHEMRMKRMRYRLERRWAKWIGMWIYALMTGYGEKWRNVILFALTVILSFALVYYSFGAITSDSSPGHHPSFQECLYFSVVTFTTLGYGDYRPLVQYQLLAVSEAFTGAFTIALFVLVFGRKVMR